MLSIALSIVAVAGWSQEANEAGAHDLSGARHVNLQVLPADLGVPRLGRLMKGYKRDLGVECSYCHVENRDTGKLDYASDENPKKAIARIMISMLDDINDRHLAQLGGDVRYAAPVTCGSCHRGRANPPAWEGAR
ncbi:MAG: c-type cytochrome [Pseudoxanthomonas sp.]